MNTKNLITAAALALLGTSAFAGGEFDPARDFPMPNAKTSTVTRAQVERQVAEARADGTLNEPVENNLFRSNPIRSSVTRAQVLAEFQQARNDGSLVPFDTGTQYAQAPKGPTLSREAVRAETLTALRAERNQAKGL